MRGTGGITSHATWNCHSPMFGGLVLWRSVGSGSRGVARATRGGCRNANNTVVLAALSRVTPICRNPSVERLGFYIKQRKPEFLTRTDFINKKVYAKAGRNFSLRALCWRARRPRASRAPRDHGSRGDRSRYRHEIAVAAAIVPLPRNGGFRWSDSVQMVPRGAIIPRGAHSDWRDVRLVCDVAGLAA